MQLRLLINRYEVERCIQSIASALCPQVGEHTLFVVVLDGATPFAMRVLSCLNAIASHPQHLQYAFVKVGSYGGTRPSHLPRMSVSLPADVGDMDRVVVMEDIIDSGRTLSLVLDHLYKHPSTDTSNITVASLLRREGAPYIHHASVHGAEVKKGDFVVGCGLDYHGRYRMLDAVYALEGAPD